MTELKDLQVGDVAYISPERTRYSSGLLRPVEIAKRGRKYFTVSAGWQERRFEILTGREKVEYGVGAKLWASEEAYTAHLKALELRDDLRKAGLEFWRANPTDEQVKAIHAIICGGEA